MDADVQRLFKLSSPKFMKTTCCKQYIGLSMFTDTFGWSEKYGLDIIGPNFFFFPLALVSSRFAVRVYGSIKGVSCVAAIALWGLLCSRDCHVQRSQRPNGQIAGWRAANHLQPQPLQRTNGTAITYGTRSNRSHITRWPKMAYCDDWEASSLVTTQQWMIITITEATITITPT